jgi:hypothetical protein
MGGSRHPVQITLVAEQPITFPLNQGRICTMKETADLNRLSVDRAKAAILFKDSLGTGLRRKLKTEFAKSPGTKRAPIVKVFQGICPVKLKEAEFLSSKFFNGTTARNPYLYDLLNFSLDRLSIKSCPTCFVQFLTRCRFCSKRCSQLGKTRSEHSRLKRISTRASPEYADRLAKATERQRASILARTSSEKACSQLKREATSLRVYGFRNPVMSSEVFRKVSQSSRLIHHGKYSDGVRVSAQGGYEKLFVDEAIKRGYEVRNPDFSLKYYLGSTCSAYHPDFLIKSTKTGRTFLVEVKSVFTLFSRGYERNCAKFKVANLWCKQNNATFLLCIVGRSKGSFDFIESPTRAKIEKEFPNHWRA